MKVAFLGTGLMGLPMAQRLLDAKIELTAYNRTPEKLEPLRAAGAAITAQPHEAISICECVILMLSDASAIRSVASLSSAFALSLSFVQRQGVDVDLFMEILRNSALYAPTFDKKLQRMLEQNYSDPNFPTKHLLKDTDLFLAEARSAGIDVSSIEGVRKILGIAVEMAFADADYSSIFSAINSN